MFQLVFAVSLAVFVSFFCSIAEAVIYSLSWARIEGMRRQGVPSAKVLHSLRKDVDKPITAILTLNTVAHTVGASLAGAAWAAVFGERTLAWFALVFTVVILVFSEIIPKSLGVKHNAALGPWLARPVAWLVRVLAPVIWACGFLARMAGKGKPAPEATEADVASLASVAVKAGMIEAHEEQAIHNILALDTRSVREIMTPRTVVYSRSMHETVDQAMELERQWLHSRFPVWDADPEDVVGVATRRDVFQARVEGRGGVRLADLMHHAVFVPETMPLDKLLKQFLESRVHLFTVLDEYGGISGVVTLEDVLEEILGREIVDETDQVEDMRELARKRRREIIAGTRGGGAE